MGYTTEFEGEFACTPPLAVVQAQGEDVSDRRTLTMRNNTLSVW